jgi:translation initiation factor IF-1
MNQSKNEEFVDGVVVESLPNLMFRVKLTESHPDIPEGEKIAYLGGKMKYNRIRVMVGDKVKMLLDEYGGKARLVRRL